MCKHFGPRYRKGQGLLYGPNGFEGERRLISLFRSLISPRITKSGPPRLGWPRAHYCRERGVPAETRSLADFTDKNITLNSHGSG